MTTHLVTTLKRQATEILSQVKKNRIPVLITEYGQPSAYLIDVQSFEEMQEKIAILEAIARGERDLREGLVLSHAAVRKKLKKWLE